MKKHLVILLAGLLTLGLAAGCKDQKAPQVTKQDKPAAQPAAAGAKSGKVVETMNSSGYTYVQVDTGTEQIWAAAPEFAVQVGDPVVVPEGLPMANYESKSLGRTFDVVYFVDGVLVGGAQAEGAGTMGAAVPAAGMPQGHPPLDKAEVEVDFSGLKKAEGGKTVGEIYNGKSQLAGKEVVLRGKVVKFSPQIMGKNWIHLQDGTGGPESNDLTITTAGSAKVGDTVLVTGIVAADKDFGYGYKYPVILEDAKVVVE